MPSRSLHKWQNNRKTRLDAFDLQYTVIPGASPASPVVDENLQAYVMLLSAHLQGFCRDLHTESAQVLIAAFPKMALLMQTLQDNRMLDKSNAATEAIRNDFRRLGLDLDGALTQDSPEATAAHAVRMKHIYHLNEWRNHCAHHNILPPKLRGRIQYC